MKYITAIILTVVMLAIPFSSAFTAINLPGDITILGGPKVIPTFVISAVARDSWVEIQTDNFPAKDNFIVTMGPMGSAGIGGIIIGTTYSGPGGRFTMRYDIPPALQGSHQIAIRLESPSSGYYAYNWFYNNTVNTTDPSPSPAPPIGYSGFPTFSIASVVASKSVTITPHNFPPNDNFLVRMNWMGTQGIAGQIVESVSTNANGKLSNTTFEIPGFLGVASQIAIRLESPETNYYAFNWFYNNSTSTVPDNPDQPSYKGYPTFAIASVVRDKNVKIAPSNFPPNDTFYVKINWMGTRGVGGYLAQTVTTDANGNLSDLKYPIPDYLKGEYQLSIRLESPYTGYYAYNWFYNNTTP
ncbi:MAG TPA: hypothetical protein DEH25_05525 [Chloroflexi bacterium]|nr:hypothetical protein [Chloroflexota bacterium]HBY07138.1 hypothetical protein [Chloroflexota bacterium]